jgi:hypothetical protein
MTTTKTESFDWSKVKPEGITVKIKYIPWNGCEVTFNRVIIYPSVAQVRTFLGEDVYAKIDSHTNETVEFIVNVNLGDFVKLADTVKPDWYYRGFHC